VPAKLLVTAVPAAFVSS